jgi:hypothetical protein
VAVAIVAGDGGAGVVYFVVGEADGECRRGKHSKGGDGGRARRYQGIVAGGKQVEEQIQE